MTPQQRRGHKRRGHKTHEHRGPRREHIEELHPVEDVPEIESFDGWDLGEEIARGIRAMDITRPTPIQALTIGPVLDGRDVIAKAETGTGKTLAFGAPMMARIDPARATVLGLVLCPTRELAQQVCDVLHALALPRGVRVALVVGGDPTHPQIAALQAGAQVVVGTPGRVLDLAGQRFLSFPWTEFVVLDEADKMFEIGFLDDIRKILAMTPDERQTLLFSATFPTEVLKLARNSTNDPLEVATARGTATVASIDQRYFKVDDADRPMALIRLLEQSGKDDTFLVFCERRTEVDRLMRRLERLPFEVKALHGGYDQASRFRVMSAFRSGNVKALVATDVASRGLDVQHVTHVINFSVPREAESYTHRIGRTGRAGRSGTAITMLMPSDQRRWQELLRHTKFEITELESPGRTGDRRPRESARAPSRHRSAETREEERPRRRESRRRETAAEERQAEPGYRSRIQTPEGEGERGRDRDRGETRGRDRDRDRGESRGRDRDRDRGESRVREAGRERSAKRDESRGRDRGRDQGEGRDRGRDGGRDRDRERKETERKPRRRARAVDDKPKSRKPDRVSERSSYERKPSSPPGFGEGL